MKKFDILSPDGIPIHRENTYNTKKEAFKAFQEWKKRYKSQGYYSSNRGRISLDKLESHCKLIEL